MLRDNVIVYDDGTPGRSTSRPISPSRSTKRPARRCPARTSPYSMRRPSFRFSRSSVVVITTASSATTDTASRGATRPNRPRRQRKPPSASLGHRPVVQSPRWPRSIELGAREFQELGGPAFATRRAIRPVAESISLCAREGRLAAVRRLPADTGTLTGSLAARRGFHCAGSRVHPGHGGRCLDQRDPSSSRGAFRRARTVGTPVSALPSRPIRQFLRASAVRTLHGLFFLQYHGVRPVPPAADLCAVQQSLEHAIEG